MCAELGWSETYVEADTGFEGRSMVFDGQIILAEIGREKEELAKLGAKAKVR